jgi:hypothetical protein
MATARPPAAATVAAATLALLLAACGAGREVGNDEYNDPSRAPSERGTGLFGEQGLLLFGTNRSQNGQGGPSGLGVNAFLWRATLDTVSFMPLASADPFGGVVLTDWYQPPAASGERFKVSTFILGQQLRSDAVRVSVFRQVQRGNAWVDAPVAQQTGVELEDRILARARELRIQSTQASR